MQSEILSLLYGNVRLFRYLMAPTSTSPARMALAGAFALAVSVLAGCASPRMQAQWTDPAFAEQSFLQNSRVLVVCDAKETVLRRLCQEQLSEQLTAAGAMPVLGPESPGTETGQPGEPVLTAARGADAKAVWVARIAPNTTVVSPGPSVGIGIGGFGIGSNVGGGVGVSVPVGGERVNTAYAADMTLTDVASGRLVWTGTVTTPASRDVNAQVASLAKTGVGAAKTAGLF